MFFWYILIIIIALFLLIYLWSTYNAFIRSRNQVKTDFANVDVQLKRRASLIDNLVEVVREYSKHEKDTFQNVALARSALNQPHGPKEAAHVENMLADTMKTLFAVSESYPKLRASENYQRLQGDLKETEDNIAKYRETYNQSVMAYNTLIQIFPNLLVSGLFGFPEEELFQAMGTDRDSIVIKPGK